MTSFGHVWLEDYEIFCPGDLPKIPNDVPKAESKTFPLGATM